ncbi:MAG: tRNA lysidine(34) synthetase TilS, partial [Proteobacteria bacterium]|nr:tRNA lysidine(34) synthetase TilS [Burkholderiales bacterium]
MALVRGAIAHAFATVARPGESPTKTVCVGLSGGCDSVVLLHALVQFARGHRLRVRALHVHHGLSPNADRWAAFCRTLCRNLGVPLKVQKVIVDRALGIGIEAAARAERYRVFAVQSAASIALAHHRDDQAETVLLQLLRGAGLRGLAAMLPSTEGAGAPKAAGRSAAAGLTSVVMAPAIVRPLLALPRATLEHYATVQGLSWIDDESNADTAFARNFIRHDVLPLLETRYPAARTTLARSARLLGEAQALIETVAR